MREISVRDDELELNSTKFVDDRYLDLDSFGTRAYVYDGLSGSGWVPGGQRQLGTAESCYGHVYVQGSSG